MTMQQAVYTHTAKLLHWLIASLLVLQYVLAELAEQAATDNAALAQLAVLANHKSVGITLLVLALVRLVWRLTHPVPPSPQTPAPPLTATPTQAKAQAWMAKWQSPVSSATHWLLYVLLFAVPLTGWLMSSASAYSVSWFNLVALPDLISANEDTKHLLQDIHHLLANLLLVLALLHIIAALLHHFWLRDGILMRMFETRYLVLFTLVLAAGSYAFMAPNGQAVPATSTTASLTKAAASTPNIPASPCASTPTAWPIDYANSRLEFGGEQAGAGFEGRFDDWQAHVHFDANQLGQSCAFVEIKLSSVNSQDADRDATVAEGDWFDTANYPKAFFIAESFRANAAGYAASGSLWIKGNSYPVDFDFQLTPSGTTDAKVSLSGTARLDRLALRLGTGDWLDTSWVGQHITVSVDLNTTTATTAETTTQTPTKPTSAP